jgi:hypothetical protein
MISPSAASTASPAPAPLIPATNESARPPTTGAAAAVPSSATERDAEVA